jgi:hypothetical protein
MIMNARKFQDQVAEWIQSSKNYDLCYSLKSNNRLET